MDFDFSAEQDALRETARDLLAHRWPAADARAALDRGPARMTDDLWRELCDLGWVGIAAPESVGGSGADLVTAAILAEECGRALLPGPFLPALAAVSALSAVVAGAVDDARDARSLLERLAGGAERATVALHGADVTPSTDGSPPRLSGAAGIVPDPTGADVVLVAASGPAGAKLMTVDHAAQGVAWEELQRVDAQEVAALTLREAPAVELGVASTLAVASGVWSVLVAADLLGTARAALEQATDYARQRQQFGRPIGSFQAVGHRLADTCLQVEVAQGLVYAAALALDERRREAEALVGAAKAWASDAAVFATESALQVHGGVGYTWEADVHLYLRRARANAVTAGDADWHRDRLAGHIEREWVDSREP